MSQAILRFKMRYLERNQTRTQSFYDLQGLGGQHFLSELPFEQNIKIEIRYIFQLTATTPNSKDRNAMECARSVRVKRERV